MILNGSHLVSPTFPCPLLSHLSQGEGSVVDLTWNGLRLSGIWAQARVNALGHPPSLRLVALALTEDSLASCWQYLEPVYADDVYFPATRYLAAVWSRFSFADTVFCHAIPAQKRLRAGGQDCAQVFLRTQGHLQPSEISTLLGSFSRRLGGGCAAAGLLRK